MKTEFEIKFISINKDEMRKKLIEIGAKCVSEEKLMRRIAYETGEKSYARIRDEGDKITCTFKEYNNCTDDISCVREVETTVGDFEAMKTIFEKIGIKEKAYQETKREIWKANGEIEFMIDTWPGLNPFIEIEGENEEVVRKYTKLLGFDYNNGVFGAVDEVAFREIGMKKDVLNNIEIITFEKPLLK